MEFINFIEKKIDSADDISHRISKVIQQMLHISYNKGSRNTDYLIRDLVEDLINEVDEYYKINRSLESSKKGDLKILEDILEFFEDHYINNSTILNKIKKIEIEIKSLHSEDIEEDNNAKASEQIQRTADLYILELEKDISTFKRNWIYSVEPYIKDLINNINDIVLYLKTENAIILKGKGPDEAKNILKRYILNRVKVTSTLSDTAGIKEDLYNILSSMGIQQGFNQLFVDFDASALDLINSILEDENLQEHIRKTVSPKSTPPSNKVNISVLNDSQDSIHHTLKEIKELMEMLHSPPDETSYDISNGVATGIAMDSKQRYLFHIPGSPGKTLKVLLNQVKDSLFHIYKWLFFELKKQPELAESLNSFIDHIPEVNSFVKASNNAYHMASDRGNQSESYLFSEMKQYITKEAAQDLVLTIKALDNFLSDAFMNSLSNLILSKDDDKEVILKKVNIVKESFNNSQKIIRKGLTNLKSK